MFFYSMCDALRLFILVSGIHDREKMFCKMDRDSGGLTGWTGSNKRIDDGIIN